MTKEGELTLNTLLTVPGKILYPQPGTTFEWFSVTINVRWKQWKLWKCFLIEFDAQHPFYKGHSIMVCISFVYKMLVFLTEWGKHLFRLVYHHFEFFFTKMVSNDERFHNDNDLVLSNFNPLVFCQTRKFG